MFPFEHRIARSGFCWYKIPKRATKGKKSPNGNKILTLIKHYSVPDNFHAAFISLKEVNKVEDKKLWSHHEFQKSQLQVH